MHKCKSKKVKKQKLKYTVLASYPFNLERKKNFYLYPMKPDEKTGFGGKNGFWWPF